MATYSIYRFYADSRKPRKLIKSGLTLEEAKEWCNREDTHKPGEWFDGYQKD